MFNIVVYQPDIPQNPAAILRICACFGTNLHIIEPCGFSLNDKRFKRVAMDYTKYIKVVKYSDFNEFYKNNYKSRVILMTTKSKKKYFNFKFKKGDFLFFGRESFGVPEEVRKKLKFALTIPMQKGVRSLNLAISVAIISSEARRQIII